MKNKLDLTITIIISLKHVLLELYIIDFYIALFHYLFIYLVEQKPIQLNYQALGILHYLIKHNYQDHVYAYQKLNLNIYIYIYIYI